MPALEPIKYPSLLRRLAAIAYDGLLLIAVSMGYGLIYIGMAKLFFNINEDHAHGVLFQIGWLASIFIFFAFFWTKGGQTTGMRAWRIKIQSSNKESKINLFHCLVRFMTAPLGWLLFMTVFFNNKRQCVHDQISKTQLILLPPQKK